MASRKTDEDNYYTRAQYNELIRTKFPPLKVYEADDGREFFIPNPQVLDDEAQDLVDDARSGTDLAKAYLGSEYDDFKAAGGQAWMVGYQITEFGKRLTATKPGDETPTI